MSNRSFKSARVVFPGNLLAQVSKVLKVDKPTERFIFFRANVDDPPSRSEQRLGSLYLELRKLAIEKGERRVFFPHEAQLNYDAIRELRRAGFPLATIADYALRVSKSKIYSMVRDIKPQELSLEADAADHERGLRRLRRLGLSESDFRARFPNAARIAQVGMATRYLKEWRNKTNE